MVVSVCSQVLYWLLHGLEVQGHHAANFNSLLASITTAYVRLRPGHSTAVDTVSSLTQRDGSQRNINQIQTPIIGGLHIPSERRS